MTEKCQICNKPIGNKPAYDVEGGSVHIGKCMDTWIKIQKLRQKIKIKHLTKSKRRV